MIAATSFVFVTGGAVLVAILAERLRVPPAVTLVCAGIVAGTYGHVATPFPFGAALFVVFLPPIVFEAAWNVDLAALRDGAARIAFLAFAGTLFTAFAVAGAVASTGALSFGAALVLGAAIAATDPVAVVAVFRRLHGVPRRIATIVEAESVLNDGVAVAIFIAAVPFASGLDASVERAVAGAVVALAGGATCGALVAASCATVMRVTRAFEDEAIVTLVLAYVAYLGATALGVSGIISTAAGAVCLRALLARDARARSNEAAVDAFWRALAFAANATVFVATGLAIVPSRIGHEPLLVAVAIGATLAMRALLACTIMPPGADRWTTFLAGMRGALPLALASSLPAGLAGRPAIVDAVFAVVVFTLVVQGVTLEPLMRRFYSGSGGPASSS